MSATIYRTRVFGGQVRLLVVWLLFSLLTELALADSPFLRGRVTDEEGRPVEDATVSIADCIGTCFGGSGRLTDNHGEYVFESKTFRNFPSLSVSMPGRYHVSTEYSGPKLHEPDSDQPRIANFVIGTPAAVTVTVEGEVPMGWERFVLLRASRDAKLHRYDLRGLHHEGWNSWHFAVVPRSEPYHMVVVHQPRYERINDRKELRERRIASRDQQIEFISSPIRFTDPIQFNVKLHTESGGESEMRWLSIESVVDKFGNDRTAELVIEDRQFGAPVSDDKQEQAFSLLQRIADAAKPWNARPPRAIARYQYDAVNASGDRTPVTITEDSPSGPSWNDISRLRGFAYMPPLRWILNQHDNVVFYDVRVQSDRATLVYRLKESRGFSAGLGVGPGWNGFFSRSFSAGRIKIDPQRAILLEHRVSAGPLGEECIETFADYVAIDGGFAPQTLRIQAGGFDFRMKFKVHDNILWLLDQASRGENETPTYRIENVRLERIAEPQ